MNFCRVKCNYLLCNLLVRYLAHLQLLCFVEFLFHHALLPFVEVAIFQSGGECGSLGLFSLDLPMVEVATVRVS